MSNHTTSDSPHAQTEVPTEAQANAQAAAHVSELAEQLCRVYANPICIITPTLPAAAAHAPTEPEVLSDAIAPLALALESHIRRIRTAVHALATLLCNPHTPFRLRLAAARKLCRIPPVRMAKRLEASRAGEPYRRAVAECNRYLCHFIHLVGEYLLALTQTKSDLTSQQLIAIYGALATLSPLHLTPQDLWPEQLPIEMREPEPVRLAKAAKVADARPTDSTVMPTHAPAKRRLPAKRAANQPQPQPEVAANVGPPVASGLQAAA